MGLALGVLGLTPEQFYLMRLKHFFLMLQEYNREKEQEIRFAAEQTRLQTTALINVQLRQADRIKPPDLWPLPWDQQTDDELPTSEDVRELYKELKIE